LTVGGIQSRRKTLCFRRRVLARSPRIGLKQARLGILKVKGVRIGTVEKVGPNPLHMDNQIEDWLGDSCLSLFGKRVHDLISEERERLL
jgi:hypothetical protein